MNRNKPDSPRTKRKKLMEVHNKQILQGHSVNIKIFPLEVSNIQRSAAELNNITTRVDKSYIQQEWHAISALLYNS